MKAAVYAGTRNVYQDMIPSMNSLLVHSDVDKIYFLIEDDEFPYDLPPQVECINVSNQTWFPPIGPNMNNRCSYMVLLRAAFPKIFPNLDTILSIDNDIIITKDISNLWDIDLTNYYFAGVKEFRKSDENFSYVNFGFILYNLKKLREDKKDDIIISYLNNYYFMEAEQSCFNFSCQNYIYFLPEEYNANSYTIKNFNTNNTKVRHFAATPKWQTFPLVKKYRDISINKKEINKYDLDIIIPHYNDLEGLSNTLNSVYNKNGNIHITVVDDCSTNCDCLSLKEKFPNVKFIKLKENVGPGIAKQIGIDSTSSEYIMFIDAGDYIISKIHLQLILDTLRKHSDAYIYSWGWYNEEDKRIFSQDKWSLAGSCFKREFLNLYNIRFSEDKKCSYSSEDGGFMTLCYLTMSNILTKEKLTHYYYNKTIIYYRTYNKESLSHKNENQILSGMAYNYEYIVRTSQKNQIPQNLLIRNITERLFILYNLHLITVKKHPECYENNLKALRYFYHHAYKYYEIVNISVIKEYYSKYMKELIKHTSEKIPKINLQHFLQLLKEED